MPNESRTISQRFQVQSKSAKPMSPALTGKREKRGESNQLSSPHLIIFREGTVRDRRLYRTPDVLLRAAGELRSRSSTGKGRQTAHIPCPSQRKWRTKDSDRNGSLPPPTQTRCSTARMRAGLCQTCQTLYCDNNPS